MQISFYLPFVLLIASAVAAPIAGPKKGDTSVDKSRSPASSSKSTSVGTSAAVKPKVDKSKSKPTTAKPKGGGGTKTGGAKSPSNKGEKKPTGKKGPNGNDLKSSKSRAATSRAGRPGTDVSSSKSRKATPKKAGTAASTLANGKAVAKKDDIDPKTATPLEKVAYMVQGVQQEAISVAETQAQAKSLIGKPVSPDSLVNLKKSLITDAKYIGNGPGDAKLLGATADTVSAWQKAATDAVASVNYSSTLNPADVTDTELRVLAGDENIVGQDLGNIHPAVA